MRVKGDVIKIVPDNVALRVDHEARNQIEAEELRRMYGEDSSEPLGPPNLHGFLVSKGRLTSFDVPAAFGSGTEATASSFDFLIRPLSVAFIRPISIRSGYKTCSNIPCKTDRPYQ